MDGRKTILVFLIIILSLGMVLAYAGEGGADDDGAPETKCTDGADNDGDGKVDGNDPGCTTPLYADDSEGDIYDLDASWIFSGNSTPTNDGPSLFYGWKVVEQGDTSSPYKDSSGSSADEIVEQYVNDSNLEWGGGNPKSVTLSITDAATRDRSGFSELIDIPRDEGAQNCGDADIDSGEGNFNCPEDRGLADDDGSTTDTSAKTLSETFNDNEGQWLADNVDPIGDHDNDANNGEYLNSKNFNDDTTDNIEYNFDNSESGFVAPEAEGSKSDDISGSDGYGGDLSGGTQSNPGEKDDQVVQDQGWTDVPDFYLKDTTNDGITNPDEIWMVYPKKTDETMIGYVIDYDLTGKKEVKKYTSSGTVTKCTGGNFNASCSGSDSACLNPDHGTDEKYTLESETTTTVSTDKNEEYYADSSGDFDHSKESSNLNTLSVDVTHDPGYNTQTVDDDTCSESTFPDSCNIEGDGGDCSFSSPTEYTAESQTIATGQTSNNISYRYEDLELRTAKVFDLNPAEDVSGNDIIDGKTALFEGDSFKSEDYSSAIVRKSTGGDAYWSYEKDRDNNDQGNDIAVSWSNFHIQVDGDKFESKRTEYHTFDADGWNGQGDGYIAIDDGSIVGSTQDFLSQEVEDGTIVNDFVSNSDISVPSCPGPHTKCVASVDVSLKNLNNWGSEDPNSGLQFDFVTGNPHELDMSLGVCKMYKTLSGDWSVNCQYDQDTSTPTPQGGANACGDEPNEHWAYMEGPEIDESVMEDNPAHYEACISEKTQCVLRGTPVNEGHVANVAPDHSNDQYEEGGNSPDWEVCLDLEGSGIGNEGDEKAGDNANNNINDEDMGGEWYDLDSETAQEYLRNGGSSLVESIGSDETSDGSVKDSNGDGTSDEHDIDYYWRQSPNPSDSTYNPEGSSEGIALEDDCGNTRFSSDTIQGCNDAEQRPSTGDVREETFYSFMNEGKREEDFNPQGDSSGPSAIFFGHVNKLSDRSDQLESSMDTSNYYTSSTTNPEIWSNSDGSIDAADQWAITQNLNWSISSRGTPYPPWGTYYRDASDQRSGPGSGSSTKTEKVFGNSYAAVADVSMTDDNGNPVDPGDGVWIDPDFLRKAWNSGDFRWESGDSNWTDVFAFKMDITGPDSGIGFDTGDGTLLNFKGSSGNQRAVIWGDIYFQGENDDLNNDGDADGDDEGPGSESWEGTDQVGETVEEHEPPVCGDDQKEFLLEEMGESEKSAQFDGRYACANTSNPCVDMSATPRIVEYGSTSQTDEPDENVGRLKNDVEVCEQRPEDDTSLWYDQDYGHIDNDGNQDTCRVNTLYGSSGVRWFQESYIKSHPHAVTGGVDDDWNQYIEDNYNTGGSDEYSDKYESLPNQSTWSFSSESPVPSGAKAVGNDSIATLGFCGGDDEGEYIVTQECRTGICETDRNVIGVTKNPGGCIFDPSTLTTGYSAPDTDKRDLYEPGEEITVNLGSDSRNIACFNNVWYEDWPVVFNRDVVNVPFTGSEQTGFQIVNVRNEETTFDVEMIDPLTDDPSAYQYSKFVEEDGDSFKVTVAPQSAKTFHVGTRGADRALGDDSQDSEDQLTVRAEAVNSDLEGEDYLTVNVVENNQSANATRTSEPKSVPGVGPIHLAVMILMSSLVFFLQS